MSGIGAAFGQFGTTIQLARIESHGYDTVSDESDPDSPGEVIPNGTLNLTMLTREGSRENVPFVMPMAGASSFIGGLPEVGTTCVVAFMDQQKPIVIGFLPPSLSDLVGTRKTIPNVQPGEVLMQAGTPDVDAAGRDNVFAGASVRLDQYGRVIISAPDYKLTCGYMLSNEYSPAVTTLNDPISGEPIFLQETVTGGTTRRVGSGGSTVWTYGKDKYERIGGKVDTQIQEGLVVIARRGQTYQNKTGSSFGLDADGNFFVTAGSGATTISAQGDLKCETGGNESHMVIRGSKHVVGGDRSMKIGNSYNVSIGQPPDPKNPGSLKAGEFRINLGLGGSFDSVVFGAKHIQALLGINLIAGIGLPAALAAVPLLPAGITLSGVAGIQLLSPALVNIIAPAVTVTSPLTKIVGASVQLGPAGTDPVVTLSGLLAFMTAFASAIAIVATTAPAAVTASIALAGSKTVLGSP